MNTYFLNFVDRVVQLCCQKKIVNNIPPECLAAEDNGLEVLNIQSLPEDSKIESQEKI